MRLGIDFGTTHTVVAFVDRGNYPVVAFEDGNAIPSVIAVRASDGALRFGAEAAALAGGGEWTILRSFKRLLDDAGPLTDVEVGGRSLPVTDLLVAYFRHLKDELLNRSNADIKKREALECAVSVPANASSAQRFLTLDAFRQAGFEVLSVINEPSAAGFEYAHRFRRTLTSKREHVLVYDMGGGTFDASLIRMSERTSTVVSSAGVKRLGGDDIDRILMDRVIDQTALELDAGRQAQLLEECRRAKEAVGVNTRRLVVDLTFLSRAPVAIPMDEVAELCNPLLERSLTSMVELVRLDDAAPAVDEEEAGVTFADVASIYVVGGASSFPVIYRQLRERFGTHRVKRSPYPFAATAIGLAISLDEEAGYTLSDVLTRHFGVFRETGAGHDVYLDVVFPKDTPLPTRGAPALTVERRYRAAHNIGHFRYVESSQVRDGQPDGDLMPWDEIRVPYDPALRERKSLSGVSVRRLEGDGPMVEEVYRCTAEGTLEVSVTVGDGFSQTFTLARRSGKPPRRGSAAHAG